MLAAEDTAAAPEPAVGGCWGSPGWSAHPTPNGPDRRTGGGWMLGQPGMERTPDRQRPRRLARRAAARGRYDGAGGRRGRPSAPATAGVGLRLPRRHLLPWGEEHPRPGADERAGPAGL